jgi:hypothetical protein
VGPPRNQKSLVQTIFTHPANLIVISTNHTLCMLEKKYFASSDPHHEISKQLVDTTFV